LDDQVIADGTLNAKRLWLDFEADLCEAVASTDSLRRCQRPFRVGDVISVSGRSTQQDGLAAWHFSGEEKRDTFGNAPRKQKLSNQVS
jgi:hypothetical protein